MSSSISFAVDSVDPARNPATTHRLIDTVGAHLCLGGDPEMRVVETFADPLIAAVHQAFSEHRPLVLTPDAIWLTIARGVAHHVRMHAEALRPRLVRHDGRELVTVEHQGPMPSDAATWGQIVESFLHKTSEHTGPGIARLLQCDFSTSTRMDRVASEIILLDALSPYFDYQLACVCGIPEITLLGTPEDWRSIRERIDVIVELDLSFWTRSLVPIADQLLRTSEGAPDIRFWQRIYKPRDAYGADRVTGWIARLYPYLKSGGRFRDPNPLLDLPIDEPRDHPQDKGWYVGPGITLASVPRCLSTAFVRVEDRVRGVREEIAIEGGLLAVAQDELGRLKPVGGYVVRRREASIHDVLDGIERDHTTEPPARGGDLEGSSAELLAMADRFDSAILFRGEFAWHIRERCTRDRVYFRLANGSSVFALRLIDLPERRSILVGEGGNNTLYVLADSSCIAAPRMDEPGEEYGPSSILPRETESTQPAEELLVVSTSLASLLHSALATHGRSELAALGRFIDHLAPWQLAPPRR